MWKELQLSFEICLAKNKSGRGEGGVAGVGGAVVALLSSDEHVRSFEMIAVTDWSALSVLS